MLRGAAILAMAAVHFLYDLSVFGNRSISLPVPLFLLSRYGHLLFILLSGICATLGQRTFLRGMAVFSAGLLVSYGTLFGELILGIPGIRICFGILHLLGFSMMVYPLFSRLPAPMLAILGAAGILLGMGMGRTLVSAVYLFPLGFRSDRVYTGSDFFPVFPNLGWFLIGAALGKSLYRDRISRFPGLPWQIPLLRGLAFCGRHSLEIYLLHQPILFPISLLL